MKILVAISLALTASLYAQQSPQKHPFTFEDMMKLKLLDGPQPVARKAVQINGTRRCMSLDLAPTLASTRGI
jgi:hypothetical protein